MTCNTHMNKLPSSVFTFSPLLNYPSPWYIFVGLTERDVLWCKNSSDVKAPAPCISHIHVIPSWLYSDNKKGSREGDASEPLSPLGWNWACNDTFSQSKTPWLLHSFFLPDSRKWKSSWARLSINSSSQVEMSVCHIKDNGRNPLLALYCCTHVWNYPQGKIFACKGTL